MATGDQADMLGRLKRLLPRWFGQGEDATPVLDALLSGPASAWSYVYGLAVFADLQVRAATATGGWLDLFAGDFLGLTVYRRLGQSDESFRAFLITSLIRPRATRPALAQVLEDLTGRAPLIREPRRIVDGAAYDARGGYNVGSGWGSSGLPSTTFVEVYRPTPGSLQEGVTDPEIFAAARSVRPAGMKVYVRIVDNPA